MSHLLQADAAYDQSLSHLRGGTPWQLYKWPYYVSVAHSTLFKNKKHRPVYLSHVVVMCVRPQYRIVYVSNPTTLNASLFDNYPLTPGLSMKDKYFYPTTLILENTDSFVVGGHINDHSSVLLRFTGLRELMTQVMTSDRLRPVARSGPPDGAVQRHVHDVIERDMGVQFVNEPNTIPSFSLA